MIRTFLVATASLALVHRSVTSLPLEDEASTIIIRETRQTSGGQSLGNCDFKVNPNVDLCSWTNVNLSAFKWLPSTGADAHWIGGPKKDQTDGNKMGGYAFFETSQLPNSAEAANTVSAMLASPELESTGSKGHCVSFSYAMDGLSVDKLRVLLQPVTSEDKKKDDKKDNSETIEDKDSEGFEVIEIAPPKENFQINFRDNQVLATLNDGTRGLWKTAHVMYSYPLPHKIILEAIPKDETDQARRYRGYIAIDDLFFDVGDACQGHCTFDSGMCGFLNENTKDDFNWEVSRGSENPNTGPIRDHSSFGSNRVTGSFAYINSGSPRRPQDKAHLVSNEFQATDANNPLCLRFWTHMFGSGIGELNVYIRTIGGTSDPDKKIWGLIGDAGNNWYMGQAPVASSRPFKIVFEGIVGKNSLGNIAIDDISVAPGVCPTSPQIASSSAGDCAFEDDVCGWTNPGRNDGLDELNWERLEARGEPRYPQKDHTTGDQKGYYMGLSRDTVQQPGDRGMLMSRELPGSSKTQCVSFWYYMYEPIVDNTGPNLGKLALWIRTFDRNDNLVMKPIWRLQNGQGPSWKYAQAMVESETNYQVVFEGVWGNSRVSGYMAVDDVTFFEGACTTLPEHATLIRAECTFDRDSCAWRNTTTGDFEWRMAAVARRPANLPDKTYGAPVGYAYFDIFSHTGGRSNKVRMVSPTITKGIADHMCFSFWFAAFGAAYQFYTVGLIWKISYRKKQLIVVVMLP